jgi:LuxR family maltose regulon positive regulatory protein
LEKVQAALNHRLTLVSAPAGFGKTTLLSGWIHHGQPPLSIAWVSIEGTENDPVHFWEYLVAALRTLQPGVGEASLQLLRSPRPLSAPSVLTPLVNELARLDRDTLLVLDDYHFISSKPVHEGIVFLLEHLPPRLHLVIATRADPPFPLARFRGSGTMPEIGADDLRFNPEEAGELLARLGVPAVSSRDIEALNTRAEGWVVGLKMARDLAQIDRGRSPPGSTYPPLSVSPIHHHPCSDRPDGCRRNGP